MRRLAAALAAVLVLGGCAAIDAAIDTEEALIDAGFADAGVFWTSHNGVETLEVYWFADAETSDALTDESLAAAGIVWRVARVHFDQVRTDPDVTFANGEFAAQRVFSRETLEREFGPRPPGLDRSMGSLLNIGHWVRWALAGFVAFLVASALVVWLVLRSSRRRRAAAA